MVSVHACPRLWEVDALREGRLGAHDAASFERHREHCAQCSERFVKDERLRALARAARQPEPDEVAVKRLRHRVLHDAALASRGGPTPRAFLAGSSLAVLALGLAVVVTRHPWAPAQHVAARAPGASPAPSYAGSVHARAGARYTHTRDGSVERVRLEAGTIEVHVRHQQPGERFLLELPDGELEVRGTTFTATVEGGATRSVAVSEGFVVLRLNGRPERSLRVRERWDLVPPPAATEATGDAGAERAGTAREARGAGAARRTRRSSVDAAAARAYEDAMQLYRGGRYALAADAFRRFAATYAGATQAEDAAFLEAASLARAGRTDAAAIVGDRFLDKYPKSSLHAPEAAMLVVRGARDRGDCEHALHVAARFAPGELPPEWRGALGRCAPAEPARPDPVP